jgi:ribulose-5-phosphate 4-epimerase/fuculose-1-phosphate aldolase
MSLHRLVVAPRSGLRRAPNKRHRIYESEYSGNFIPVFQPVGLISTPEKGMALARTLQGQNGVLLRGHGTVVVGTTLEQAVLRAIYLEFEARTQIRSRSAGEPIPYTTSESDLFKRTVAVEHAWHYYLDKFRQSVKNETSSHK